ncbi:MAG: YraN family protein [Anaerolineales bacterium]|nr:MAG: YraN family protein [Anaerolineales bacterium]
MATPRQQLGRWGEQAAASYLQARGYTLLAHNLRTPHGEIDLLMRKEDRLIFVEVKTRRSTQFGPPEGSVTLTKQAHLIAAAESYMQTQPADIEWRIDVIAVYRQPGGETEITHFENAVHG